MYSHITYGELLLKLTDNLIIFGLPSNEAILLANECAQKARKKITPKESSLPPVTITDCYHTEGYIRMRLPRDYRRTPFEVLESYLQGRTKYPDPENMLIELEFGGIGISSHENFRVTHRVKTERVRVAQEIQAVKKPTSFLKDVGKLSPAEFDALVSGLKDRMKSE